MAPPKTSVRLEATTAVSAKVIRVVPFNGSHLLTHRCIPVAARRLAGPIARSLAAHLKHRIMIPTLRRLTALLFMLLQAATAAPADPTLTIFGSATPQTPVAPDAAAVTLGVKFRSSQTGKVSGIRFYRGASSRDGYAVKLFAANGSLLAAAKTWKDTCAVPCWEQVNFASPVTLAANTTYVAAYYTSNGKYAADKNGLTNGYSGGPLTVPASAKVGGNGVYTYSAGFPSQTSDDSNYFVDVAFTPTGSVPPHLTLSFDPPSPPIASNSPPGTVVATITAAWSDGAPFTGTVGFGPPYYNDAGSFAISGNKLIVNPEGPGISALSGTTRNVTITATQ
jgi:Domain of unknown function (DUF4082)